MMGRRYFCTRKSNAESSPALTRSITSASVSSPAVASAAAAFECTPIAGSPYWSATLLTLELTRSPSESCGSSWSWLAPDVPLLEGLADGDAGLDFFHILAQLGNEDGGRVLSSPLLSEGRLTRCGECGNWLA